MRIPESELILNPDGSIYHLNLLPHQIAHDIITVGDPDRVDHVAEHFDKINHIVHKREFKTVTGEYREKPITVLSTGIGTDNIDIVFNELDALVNVDLVTRELKQNHTQLRFFRLGTSGAIRPEVDVDSIVISRHAIGLEGLMHYYHRELSAAQTDITHQAKVLLQTDLSNVLPYTASASTKLIESYQHMGRLGITTTATGFYGPQGRSIRLRNQSNTFLDLISQVSHDGIHATNLEMETAGIYGLAELLGHQAISFNAILANRVKGEFSAQPGETVAKLIVDFLESWERV